MINSILIILITAIIPVSASATLGKKFDSTDSQKKLHSNVDVVAGKSNYSIHELKAGLGTVREYVTNDGNVIAVTWNGPKQPDLNFLLGNYFNDYYPLASKRPLSKTRAPLFIQNTRVTIFSVGRPRNFRGQAILPNNVNLRTEDLQ